MSDDQIISDIIRREGSSSNAAGDKGGRTVEGISEASNPDLFAGGHTPTDAQVRQRYEDRYIKGPHFDQIADEQLKSLLVDWGVTSGPAIAIQALQRLVGVPVDGALGPATLKAVGQQDPVKLVVKLVAERVKMIGRIVSKNPSQAKFAAGWLNRAVEWLS
jgi:lysozyme family protein